ncbi:ATP-grasp ribosomal peptide maturase [Saccharothrix longispora]|uniref:ATP-grasp ribosomal peptide maturase n=1 Tax=Saccharothrix longispora TaxID=33920 RepID=UPI0028FD81A5|nr:ATP-grasp ribosomal peptide maturase [Saccharothrix longispora]MDU0289715.1 ATP-grasp ribosomal peptide maturase [Saccharothrix longispora]
MTVLIISGDADPTTNRVVRELDKRSTPVFRCDVGWFPAGLALDAVLDGSRWRGSLGTPHRAVRLEDLRSVLFRGPTGFTFEAGLSPAELRHVRLEARLGLGGVLMSLPVLWCNHPARQADAGYKPLQLAVAAQCGFLVPATMVTNDPEAVLRFTASVPHVVSKVLGVNRIDDGAVVRIAYTRFLETSDLVDLEGVRTTAHLFQEWLEKSYEVRVVAVGSALFAVAIHAHSAASRIDWRSDYEALSYSVVDLPKEVAASIRRFLEAFGLAFAAFDFVVTTDGRWRFLEANPAGQYGWLEDVVDVPISAAVADFLAGVT